MLTCSPLILSMFPISALNVSGMLQCYEFIINTKHKGLVGKSVAKKWFYNLTKHVCACPSSLAHFLPPNVQNEFLKKTSNTRSTRSTLYGLKNLSVAESKLSTL